MTPANISTSWPVSTITASITKCFLLSRDAARSQASTNQKLAAASRKGKKQKQCLHRKQRNSRTKDEETGEEVERVAIVGFEPVPVFDIAQTEGEEIERGMTTKAEISLDHVLKAAQTLSTIVEFRPMEFFNRRLCFFK